LLIHRIPGSPLLDNNKEKKEIVFIQHGILASSDSWILRGPGKDLGMYLLLYTSYHTYSKHCVLKLYHTAFL